MIVCVNETNYIDLSTLPTEDQEKIRSDNVFAIEICNFLRECGQLQMDSPILSVAIVESQETLIEPVENTQETLNTSNDFQWDDKLIKLLLRLRLDREELFNRPKCNKKKLWTQISQEINKNSASTTPSQCDSKYRNLLATYRKNLKKKKSSGEEAIKWEYFTIMDEVLGTKDCHNPPEENIGSSLVSNVPTTSEAPPKHAQRQQSPRKRKRDPILEYIEYQKRRDEEESIKRQERFDKQCALREKEIKLTQDLIELLKTNKDSHEK